MCPKCSNNLFCAACKDKITTNRCPTCQAQVSKNDYIRVRALEKVMEKWRRDKQQGKCKTHGMLQILYCVDCSRGICPFCALQTHSDHRVEELMEVYLEVKENIDNCYKQITDHERHHKRQIEEADWQIKQSEESRFDQASYDTFTSRLQAAFRNHKAMKTKEIQLWKQNIA